MDRRLEDGDLPLRAPRRPDDLAQSEVPTISVIVPAFNAAETIGEALESALSQSVPALEIVVSDDGSTDDLLGALRPFEPHVRVVSGVNAGLATARNRAASVARGEVLALLDADDVWLPDRIRAIGAAASLRPDLSILTTDATVIRDGDGGTERYYESRAFEIDDQPGGILRENFIFGAGAIRTNAFREVGGYTPGVRYAEDWDLWVRLVLRGHRAGLIEAPLYRYRRRANSLSGQKVDLALGVLEMLERSRELVAEPRHRLQLKRTTQQWRELAASHARRTSDARTRSLAMRAALGTHASPRRRVRFATMAALPTLGLTRGGHDS